LAKIRKFLGIKINLEMLLLAQETLKQGGKTIVVKYGKPIYPSELDKRNKDQEWAYEIKKRVYDL
jgi:16S rRNA G1207 methylase RsmC